MKRIFTMMLLVISSLVGFSQATWLAFSQKGTQLPARELEDAGARGLDVHWSVPGTGVWSSVQDAKTYQLMNIDGFGKLQQPGLPALPVVYDMVAVPEGAEAVVTVGETTVQEMTGYRIHPALEPARDTEGVPTPDFKVDEKFYAQDKFYPEAPVMVKEVVTYRGHDIAVIQYCPVQYNPATGVIRVFSEVDYHVDFGKTDHFIASEYASKGFLKNFPQMVINNRVLKQEAQAEMKKLDARAVKGERKDYIIVTVDKYAAAAQKLAAWRNQMGYTTEIVSKGGWNADDVDAAIKERWDSWEPKPDYFVILGDHDDVPAIIRQCPSGEDFGTDLYYASFDSQWDYFPDIAHGRISVKDANEAIMVVDKIVNYEKFPVEKDAFYEKGLNCAQFQDDENDGYATRRFCHTSENIRDYVMDQGYDVSRVYYANSYVTPTHYNNGYYSNGEAIPAEMLKSNGFDWGGNVNDIAAEINDGRFYVFHRDHGYAGGSGWAHPEFVTGSMGLLHNGNETPVVFSINCHTGEFTLPECFAESFLRHSNGGAVGVFGASYYSYSGYNDGLSCGFADAIWAGAGLIPNFGNGAQPSGNPVPHDPIYTMGDVLNQGEVRMGQTWGINRYTNELFHYFGDPAMRIFTAVPQSITAVNSDTIFYESMNSIDVSSVTVDGSLATLTCNGVLVSKAEVSGGSVTLSWDALNGDEAVLTISKHNSRPYIDTLYIAGKTQTAFAWDKNNTCNGKIVFTDETLYHPAGWNWSFGDGTTSSEQNPVHEYVTNGVFTVSLTTSNKYGDVVLEQQDIITVERPMISVKQNGAACVGEPVTLQADAGGIVNWYDEETSVTPVFTGETFVTPALNVTTSYFAQRVGQAVIASAKPDKSGDGSYGSSIGGVLFDAEQTFLLKSVKVYAEGAKKRKISLRDKSFNQLKSVEVDIPEGESRVALNWSIEPGEKLMLVAESGHKLYYNTTGIDYPYVVDEVLNIYGSTFVPAPQSKYYCFYDWEIEAYTCSSERIEAIANVGGIPDLGISVDMADPIVNFTAAGTDVTNFAWDFGDGTQSTGQTVSHHYIDNGDFTVRLIGESSCGKDTVYSQVLIKAIGLDELPGANVQMWPNPVSDMLSISMSSVEHGEAKISVLDATGRLLETHQLAFGPQEATLQVDTHTLPTGIYFVRVSTGHGVMVRRVVVQ